MLWRILWTITDHLTGLLTHLVRLILVFSCLFSTAYAFGWIQRLLHFVAEQTATHLLWNGTPVTIGTLEVDLVRGRVWATNVIIHTPKRDEWKWESPLICRIGKVYCEHNWISSFCSMVFRMACSGSFHQQPQTTQILEIYTLEISDVQGFIERRQNIYNFFLMDRLFVLPDPKDILEEEERQTRLSKSTAAAAQQQQHPQQQQQDDPQSNSNHLDPKQSSASSSNHQYAGDNHSTASNAYSEASVDLNFEQEQAVEAAILGTSLDQHQHHPSEGGKEHDLLHGAGVVGDAEDAAMANRQAQQLVDDMFQAVKSIGRAARKRGSIAMALQQQRAQLTSKLKALQGTKNKSEKMQEGVKVIQRVGQAVAKKSKDIQMLPSLPPRLDRDIPPVYGRVGRIVIEDARIFTRTSNTGGGNNSRQQAQAATADGVNNNNNNSAMSNSGMGAKWNKPIGISEIVLRSSELCPPTSLVDDNGLPAIYQPLDKIVEVVWKRTLVGMAKSNTSRFLQTALGEMLELEYLNLASSDGPNNTGGGGAVVGGDPYSDVGGGTISGSHPNGISSNNSQQPHHHQHQQQQQQKHHRQQPKSPSSPPPYRRSGTAPSVLSETSVM